jgi:hypothetical protein
MFKDDALESHLKESSVLRIQSLVTAEWNMNIASNILKIGNYRNRPTQELGSLYQSVPHNFDINDDGGYYTNATDSNIVIGGLLDDEDIPIAFQSKKEKEKMLYSLEDCFGKFRPRSGINKLRFFDNAFSHYTMPEMSQRPRYYMPDKEDGFKYWTSYRTEVVDGLNVERGIAKNSVNGQNFIEDAAPFVVYKEPVPVNRVIVKMQTNVGEVDLGEIQTSSGVIQDPFFGYENQTTPESWKVQVLQDNSWIDIASFDEGSAEVDGNPIIGSDGYLELAYGLLVPEKYKNKFYISGYFSNSGLLPATSLEGAAYLVGSSTSDPGTYYVWDSGQYDSFIPEYGWYANTSQENIKENLVSNLSNPEYFLNQITGSRQYKEVVFIGGLRIVVNTMNRYDSTFDLIELSPRLAVDLSDRVEAFSIQKTASDLGSGGLPVGQLLASVGAIDIFDYDQSFNQNNNSSIVSKYLSENIKIKFYEIVLGVNGFNYYVPIKTAYSEGFPEISSEDRSVSINLRDQYYMLESRKSPQIMIQSASLSYAVSMLLDSIGFSNYIFKRIEGEPDPIIPYFFVPPDTSVAEVLNNIAISTQSAMFFDEYNNFVVMTKEYMLPSQGERDIDIVLNGSSDSTDSGILENETSSDLANVVRIASQNNEVFNDGKINYTTRYIQRTYGSLRQASLIDKEKVWIYKPVLLWEIAGESSTKSFNEETSNQSSYALTAIPLNTDLSDQLPVVRSGQIENNVIDFGESVYWMPRYNGYFYSNGEIVKYDAVEYSVTTSGESGNYWISSLREYQNYFSKLSFNGKIYPTGRVRIYSEPRYEEVGGVARLLEGDVAKHGRAQFGTSIAYHNSGLSEYWTSDQSLGTFIMKSELLFSGPRQLVLTGANSESSTVISVSTTASIRLRSLVTISPTSPGGSGRLSNIGETIVTEIIDDTTFRINIAVAESLDNAVIIVTEPATGTSGMAGTLGSSSYRNSVLRNGIIKNFLSSEFTDESNIGRVSKTKNGTIQSSALIMSGPEAANPLGLISYSYKELSNNFKHFGTRFRISGSIDKNLDSSQSPFGAMNMYEANVEDPNSIPTVAGASGGLAVLLNSENNNGYFFELAALNQNTFSSNSQNSIIENVLFYKVAQDTSYSRLISSNLSASLSLDSNQELTLLTANATGELSIGGSTPTVSERILVTGQTNTLVNGYYLVESVGSETTRWVMRKDDSAIPIKLWGGLANVLVDDGKFTGQARMVAESNPTVYDLAVEYEDVGSVRRFYLYLNGSIIATVDDAQPLPAYSKMALFVRGTSRCMFENIYAVTANYANNSSVSLETPAINEAFGAGEVNLYDAFNKYAIPGLIQSTYLSNISSTDTPKYNIYFEEFGTIMREAAYFNIKYDKAYPALYAKISPTFNRLKGYTISGFTPDAYGAEFLIFNNTDTVLSLDETSGNYLRIQGVSFTQQSSQELSVDDYFANKSNFSDPEIQGETLISNPSKSRQEYQEVKFSRMNHGRKEFVLDAPYIQTQDDATNLMSWITSKIMKPRKSVGLEVFGMPIIQLGDIVSINYASDDGVDAISPDTTRFVVYNIEYTSVSEGPQMTIYVSEVV